MFYSKESGLASKSVLQLSFLIELDADVEAAYKLALNVELGESGPVAECLQALVDLWVLEDVKEAEGWDHCAHVLVEESDHLCAELALWVVRIALHEKHYIVLLDQSCQSLLQSLTDSTCRQRRCKSGCLTLIQLAEL